MHHGSWLFRRLVALIALSSLIWLVASAGRPGAYTLATADGLSLSFSADGLITSLQIDGDELVSTSGPALLVRDLSQAGSVSSPNLLTNPGFENDLNGWSKILNKGLDVQVVTSVAHSGRAALQFSNSAAKMAFAAYSSASVSVTPGQRYRVFGWFRSSTGYVSSPSGTSVFLQSELWQSPQRTNGLYLQWLDGAQLPLADPQLAVALHGEVAHWRLIRRELHAPAQARFARVMVAAKLGAQSLWVDDLYLVASPEEEIAVQGTLSPCLDAADCLTQSAVLSNGLQLHIRYSAQADHLTVVGQVTDTSGQDRALDIRWGLPLSADRGGSWWDDVHIVRPLSASGIYANDVSASYDGWLPISLYPYAGITQANKGLALGLPSDRPQLALLSYDGATGRYGATFHLGISPQAGKVGPRAAFALVLYRFDPAWGFRDVIARHHALYPKAYSTPRALYGFSGRSQGAYYTPKGAQEVLAEDQTNTYSAQYTDPRLQLRIAANDAPRPTLDQALAVVTTQLASPNASVADFARAISHSAVVGANGDYSLKGIGVFAWDPGHWEALWTANLDPDLQDGLASFLLNRRIEPAFQAAKKIDAHLDGVQIDNFMSEPAFDLRLEALAAADWPLTYEPNSYRPAVHTGFALREYLQFLRSYLDDNWGTDRGITVNFWGLGHPNYLSQYLDAFGSEGGLKDNGQGPNFNPAILDYRRAIAYDRPYLFANQTRGLSAAEARSASQLALLYGVLAGHGPNGAAWEPGAAQIVDDTAELVRRYWASGWRPLTYARADQPEIWIERFGGVGGTQTGPAQAELYFTVHNRSDIARTATISIETLPLALGDPSSRTISDLVSDRQVPFDTKAGQIVIRLQLDPGQTRVLHLIRAPAGSSSGGMPAPLSLP